MPQHCAALSCTNRRTLESRALGITFHKFPKDTELRRKWEAALGREKFTASRSSVICSGHFKQEDFDRTGQTVRLREKVIPSIFTLQTPEKGRTRSASRQAGQIQSGSPEDEPQASASLSQPQDLKTLAEESLSLSRQDEPEASDSDSPPKDDVGCGPPDSPASLKARLNEALAKVESLEREKRDAVAAEERAKTTMKNLLEDLKAKNLISEELKQKLDF